MATLFIDLDGTLTDPQSGITQSLVHALNSIGHPAPAPEDLTWAIGPPIWDSLRHLKVPEEKIDPAVTAYRARYAQAGLLDCIVYAGVPEMLAALKAAGHALHLATSKPTLFARRITAHFGLSQYLTHEFGSELDGTHARKPDLLAHGLAVSGADPSASFMLGDRKYDAEGAFANGLTMIGALWGHGGRTELTEAGVDILADDPAQIPALLNH